jgi:hypothetical protein
VLDGVFDDCLIPAVIGDAVSKPDSAASNTEDEMKRREGNVVSALILRARAGLQVRICGRVDDAKDTLIESLQKAKQQRKLDAAAGRQIHSILQLRW